MVYIISMVAILITVHILITVYMAVIVVTISQSILRQSLDKGIGEWSSSMMGIRCFQ